MASKKNTVLVQVRRVFVITLVLNLLVATLEIGWGYWTHTLSLTADGFHSLLDGASNIVGIVGLNIAMQPPDTDHPYGHRKFEALAAMFISFLILLTCFEIVSEAVGRFSAVAIHPEVSSISFGVKLFGLGVNIFVTNYESRRGRELNNTLLMTDAKHTFSDILVSISVLCTLVFLQMGLYWLDLVMAFVIALIILWVGYQVIREHMGSLVDEAVLDPEAVEKIVMAVPGVLGCHKIRSRGMADHIFLDLHIQVDPMLNIKEAHRISGVVKTALKAHYDGQVNDVLVHVEEYEPESA